MIGLLVLLSGCVTLDSAVFNGIPCEEVSTETCSAIEEPWDRICTRCDEAYPWDKAYDWMDGTLQEGETIRPIDPETVDNWGVTSADGLAELDVYRIPSHFENPATAQVTIIYSHGNYASIEHYVPRVRFLHEAGYEVVTWDYRGYGKTLPGESPTPQQLMDDALTVRRFVQDELDRDSRSVALYGYSLGALPAVEMGLSNDACAMVLECPWTSLDAIVAGNTKTGFPAVFMSEGLFENTEKIAGYTGPLLVMSAGLDDVFPPDDVEDLVDNAGGETEWWLVDDAHHGLADQGVPEMGYDAWADHLDTFLVGPDGRCSPR